MRGDHYRTKNPILCIHTDQDQHKTAVSIPQDAIVEILGADIKGNRLVDVLWEGKTEMEYLEHPTENTTITPREIAERMCISVHGVYALLKAKQIPAIRRPSALANW